MPTLYSRGVTSQISVADLAKTTTQVSSGEIERVKRAFIEGAEDGTLWETAIPCDGDNAEMQFLGDYQSIPFHTVHAGKEFFNIQAEKERITRPARQPDDLGNKVNTQNVYYILFWWANSAFGSLCSPELVNPKYVKP